MSFNSEILKMNVSELKLYKQYLISIIQSKDTPIIDVKELQRKTRQIDKRIKSLLIKNKKERI